MAWSDRITHLDRGDLIQIAAPDASSKRVSSFLDFFKQKVVYFLCFRVDL